MITIYTGRPGSGKSYHGALDAYNYLAKGKTVIANFELFSEQVKPQKGMSVGTCYFVSNEQITAENLIGYALHNHQVDESDREAQALLLIDEAQVLYNARDWKNPNRPIWCEFFQQHRKFGYEVVLISQSQDFIDKQIRECIQFEVNHRLMSNLGLSGKFLSLFGSKGNLFMLINYTCQPNACYGIHYVRPTSQIRDFYKTKKLFNSNYLNYDRIKLMVSPDVFAEHSSGDTIALPEH